MKIKSLDAIWEDYINNDEKLPELSKKDLIYHLKNDPYPNEAIILATDMRVMETVPFMAKFLDHPDSYIRELVIGYLLGRLFQSQYAEKGLKMAKEDLSSGVRGIAISSLGAVIDDVDKKLRQEIADYVYHVLIDDKFDALDKQSAYGSILDAMWVPITEWPSIKLEPNIEELVDKDLLEKFCKKYNVKMAPTE